MAPRSHPRPHPTPAQPPGAPAGSAGAGASGSTLPPHKRKLIKKNTYVTVTSLWGQMPSSPGRGPGPRVRPGAPQSTGSVVCKTQFGTKSMFWTVCVAATAGQPERTCPHWGAQGGYPGIQHPNVLESHPQEGGLSRTQERPTVKRGHSESLLPIKQGHLPVGAPYPFPPEPCARGHTDPVSPLECHQNTGLSCRTPEDAGLFF